MNLFVHICKQINQKNKVSINIRKQTKGIGGNPKNLTTTHLNFRGVVVKKSQHGDMLLCSQKESLAHLGKLVQQQFSKIF